jgi:tRNA-specific 2-thiouridylase
MAAEQHVSGPVVVGLSGGVDSSVAALLLRQAGFDVRGVFMKNWEGDDSAEHCAAEDDFRDAQQVAHVLGIEIHGVNFAKEYWDRVFRHFLSEYDAGRTPNPDILCNREIKFRAFLDYALTLGAEAIATGHYARVRRSNGRYQLLKARDESKDQTYFLYTLGQNQLARVHFPLGQLNKHEVRELARQHDLITHDKKDSTGICFIGERNFRDFLSRYLPARPGEIRTPEDEYLGQHEGLMYYTLGQRKGLGIGGRTGASEEPWYVVGKDLQANVLLVAQGHDHPLLFSRWLEASELTWISGSTPGLRLRCRAKTRYRQSDQDCTIELIDEDRCRVRFDEPQRAVTPGQAVVFYTGAECLGGGTITNSERTTPSEL